MVIRKIINNNIVSSVDPDGNELILMGKGLGFGKKKGQSIEDRQIEKKFCKVTGQVDEKLIGILQDIPLESLEAAELIISHAKSIMGESLKDTVYLSVTDHINCAIGRLRSNAMMSNPLLWEIKTYYPMEFKAGLEGIALLKKKMNISFPVDEAGFLALHFIMSEYGTRMVDAMNIPQAIAKTVAFIEEHFDTKIQRNSIHYERFITHYKFFIARVFQDHQIPDKEADGLDDLIMERYRACYDCAIQIKAYIENKYHVKIGKQEILFLAIHIQRVLIDSE